MIYIYVYDLLGTDGGDAVVVQCLLLHHIHMYTYTFTCIIYVYDLLGTDGGDAVVVQCLLLELLTQV